MSSGFDLIYQYLLAFTLPTTKQEVVVVVRAAGQVALRAGAAHAGGEPARVLVVASGAREVARDGRRVVGRGRRLGEVDGQGGDHRRLGAR